MSLKNEQTPTYSRLDRLSTEELKKLLYRDFMASEDEDLDPEYLTAILEVIHEREEQDDSIPPVDVDAAWQDFQDYYLDLDSSQCDDSPQQEALPHSSPSGRSPKSKRRPLWFRLLPAAVVIFAVFLSGPVMTSAFRFNLFEVIAGWTSEQFTFSVPWRTKEAEEQPTEDPYEYLRSTVAMFTDNLVVPKWFPPGTQSVTKIMQETMSDKTRIKVTYEYDNGSFYFAIYFYDVPQEESPVYQKDDNIIAKHVTHGITHYIMQNNGKSTAAWRNGNVEVIIQGDLTIDELEEMIDSIYEGVDNE